MEFEKRPLDRLVYEAALNLDMVPVGPEPEYTFTTGFSWGWGGCLGYVFATETRERYNQYQGFVYADRVEWEDHYRRTPSDAIVERLTRHAAHLIQTIRG